MPVADLTNFSINYKESEANQLISILVSKHFTGDTVRSITLEFITFTGIFMDLRVFSTVQDLCGFTDICPRIFLPIF